jgi:hypothetical protein
MTAQIRVDLESRVRLIDMGQVGDNRFMPQVGMGFLGQIVK